MRAEREHTDHEQGQPDVAVALADVTDEGSDAHSAPSNEVLRPVPSWRPRRRLRRIRRTSRVVHDPLAWPRAQLAWGRRFHALGPITAIEHLPVTLGHNAWLVRDVIAFI